jgi:tetratricopeptide (TPR) repeat protein
MSPLPSNILRWQVLEWLGCVEGRMRRFAAARRHYNTALSIAKRPDERGRIYSDYAATEHIAGNRQKALTYYRRAQELVNSDPYILATISDSIGLLYLETEPRSYKMAQKHLKESVTIRENILHSEGLASTHLNLGELYRCMYLEEPTGRPNSKSLAQKHFHEALAYARVNEGIGYAKVLLSIGDFHLDNAELRDARAKFRAVFRIYKKYKYPPGIFRYWLSFFELRYLEGAKREELTTILDDAGKIPARYTSKSGKVWLKVLKSAIIGKLNPIHAMTSAQKHRIDQMMSVPRMSTEAGGR